MSPIGVHAPPALEATTTKPPNFIRKSSSWEIRKKLANLGRFTPKFQDKYPENRIFCLLYPWVLVIFEGVDYDYLFLATWGRFFCGPWLATLQLYNWKTYFNNLARRFFGVEYLLFFYVELIFVFLLWRFEWSLETKDDNIYMSHGQNSLCWGWWSSHLW